MSVKIVAEAGINHNGEVDIAKRLMKLASDSGADAVKFQKRTIELVYSPEDLAKPKKTKFGSTYGDEKHGLEFGSAEYDEIDAYSKEIGIPWFASVWDIPSVQFMERYETPWLKLASCCCNYEDLLEAVSRSGQKSILSTGMSTDKEISMAATILLPNLEYMLHTTSIYPCPDNLINLQAMLDLSFLYSAHHIKIGFSSHSPKVIFPAAATALGAKMVEFHITLDTGMEGPDHAASIGPIGVKRIVDHIRAIEAGQGRGRHEPTDEELEKGRKYPWRG